MSALCWLLLAWAAAPVGVVVQVPLLLVAVAAATSARGVPMVAQMRLSSCRALLKGRELPGDGAAVDGGNVDIAPILFALPTPIRRN